MSSIRSQFGFWKKLTVFVLLLCLLTFILATYLNMRFADVLFVEGLLTFAFGAYVAAGMGNMRTVSWKTNVADSEYYQEYLEDQRPKQVSEGIILMIIGGALTVLSIVIGLSTLTS